MVLPKLEAGDTILISDWGALELVRAVRDDLVIILGAHSPARNAACAFLTWF
jgi:hypothetical protein